VQNNIVRDLKSVHEFRPEVIMKVLYTAKATTVGGRTGHSKTDDGRLDLDLSTPRELGGDGGAGTNPEQLFAVGYSACFMGALKFVAGKEKVTIPADATITGEIGIGARDDGTGFGITAKLTLSLPGIDRAKAEDLVQKAHIVCPYSHATRGNIDVTLVVA
jgi:lipoyl-dependent peroxiredoxin